MKKTLFLLAMIAAAGLLIAESPPMVYIISVAQRTDGSCLVDIHYNLDDQDNDACYVMLRVSSDGGEHYDIFPDENFLSGDIGSQIRPGPGKHIIWNYVEEGYSFDGDRFRFKIIADDGSTPNVPPDFIFVQGGTLQWGNSTVRLSSFWVDKYELSQWEWYRIMKTTPWDDGPAGEGFPVYRISWFDCIAYCNKRSERERREPCYSYSTFGTDIENWPQGWDQNGPSHNQIHCNWAANGYRMLTDMEWRYAALGGAYSHNYTYSGSDDVDEVAWVGQNSGNEVHPVGTKMPNEIGIYDMTGNVWEWCWDKWDTSYVPGNVTDPHGPAYSSYRLTSGASYNTAMIYCPISWYNCGGLATSIYWNTGVRICVRDEY